MPRGGRRTGKTGKAYPNRSDLNPSAQAASVTRPPRIRAGFEGAQGLQSTPAAAQQQPAPPAGPEPGSLGALGRPTENPNEPITAGLPIGAGPGPEVLPHPPGGGGALQELRALYLRFPFAELRELIEDAEERQRGSVL